MLLISLLCLLLGKVALEDEWTTIIVDWMIEFQDSIKKYMYISKVALFTIDVMDYELLLQLIFLWYLQTSKLIEDISQWKARAMF